MGRIVNGVERKCVILPGVRADTRPPAGGPRRTPRPYSVAPPVSELITRIVSLAQTHYGRRPGPLPLLAWSLCRAGPRGRRSLTAPRALCAASLRPARPARSRISY